MLYTDTKKRATQTYNERYDEGTQQLLLTMLLSDPDAFAICRSILHGDYFDDRLRPMVQFITDYAEQYGRLPAVEQVRNETGISVEKFSETGQHTDYLLKTVEGFCQYKAMELAVLDGIELLQTGRAGEIVERAKAALTIGLSSTLGINYFDDPAERLRRMLERAAYVSTGWAGVDEKLYGGLVRGELNIFAGSSGSGKSLFLQNLAVNWSLAGYVVVYLSLELHEDQVSLRFDAMITGRGTREVLKDIDNSVVLIRNKQRVHKPGTLYIRKLPEAGTTVNTLRGYIKEFQIKTGLKPDGLIIDYLDLMYPVDSRVDPANVSLKDKYVSEELRALMHEINCFGATASQLNRTAVAVDDYDHSHIAGGLSKIMTADNVLGLISTLAMKEKGRYKLQFLKTRSSASVGHTLELAYDPKSMRISDLPDEVDDVDKPLSTSQLQRSLKSPPASTAATVIPAAVTPAAVTAAVGTTSVFDRLRAKTGVADRM